MKTYLVLLQEKSKQPLDMSLLQAHVQHLQRLKKAGQLILCGPFADDTGAMLVLNSDSVAEVEALLCLDPFVRDCYYASYTITEFYAADESNHYLMDHEQTHSELNRDSS